MELGDKHPIVGDFIFFSCTDLGLLDAFFFFLIGFNEDDEYVGVGMLMIGLHGGDVVGVSWNVSVLIWFLGVDRWWDVGRFNR